MCVESILWTSFLCFSFLFSICSLIIKLNICLLKWLRNNFILGCNNSYFDSIRFGLDRNSFLHVIMSILFTIEADNFMFSHWVFFFRVSLVTIECGKSKYLSKAIICKPDQQERFQQFFQGLSQAVSKNEFPVTHGSCSTPIDFTSSTRRDGLKERIQRHQRYRRQMIYTRITGLSKVDPFIFAPQIPLLDDREPTAPNIPKIV